ncbi:MAG: DNA repair protein RecN (Recombination protein N), partial [Candidatus Omnitrophota bacterium]
MFTVITDCRLDNFCYNANMLTQLSIQNFGLIEELNLDFHANLNILTGETGAGKSIVIGALRIALGEKLMATQVRDKDKDCVVEAVFDLANTELESSDLVEDLCAADETLLIIHRSFKVDGRKKVKINGKSVTVSQLKEIGVRLMDFHGPHDHQMLFSVESHLGILDRLVAYKSEMTDYTKIYTEYKAIQKQLSKLQNLSASREREVDMLSHQVRELEQVSLEDEVYEDIKARVAKLNHAEKLSESVNNLVDIIDGDQGSNEKIRQAFSPMQSLNRIDESTQPLMDQLSQLQDVHDQLLVDIRDYAQSLSFDGSDAKDINAKYDNYYDILKKYGPTLLDARNFYTTSKERYDLLENLEHNDETLRKQLAILGKDLKKTASKIT